MDPFKTAGAFSWCELITSDAAAAAGFYGDLFGWQIKEAGPEMGGYRTVHVGDGDSAGIGGIMAKRPEMGAVPPHWGCYVTVDDLDATLARCGSLGGKTMMPPMEIPNVGRMAVIQDPQGAVVSVIQYAMG